MNKKIFGIRIGTLISLLVCVVVAFCIWLYANYIDLENTPELVHFFQRVV